MRRLRLALALLLILTISGSVFLLAIRPDEPQYQGIKLEAWLTELDDWDCETRIEACVALERMGPKAVSHLLRLFDENTSLLQGIRKRSIKTLFPNAAPRPSADIRNKRICRAFFCLGQRGVTGFSPLVDRTYGARDPMPALTALDWLLAGWGRSTQVAAGTTSPEGSEPQLSDRSLLRVVALSRHSDPKVQKVARTVLLRAVQCAPSKFVNVSKALRYEDTQEALFALLLVERIGQMGNYTIEPLRTLLAHENPIVRLSAVSVAGRLTNDTQALLPLLLGRRDDPDARVRRMSDSIIKRLRPGN